MMEQTILVVDDDIPLTKTLEKILRSAHYRPIVANTAGGWVRVGIGSSARFDTVGRYDSNDGRLAGLPQNTRAYDDSDHILNGAGCE